MTSEQRTYSRYTLEVKSLYESGRRWDSIGRICCLFGLFGVGFMIFLVCAIFPSLQIFVLKNRSSISASIFLAQLIFLLLSCPYAGYKSRDAYFRAKELDGTNEKERIEHERFMRSLRPGLYEGRVPMWQN